MLSGSGFARKGGLMKRKRDNAPRLHLLMSRKVVVAGHVEIA